MSTIVKTEIDLHWLQFNDSTVYRMMRDGMSAEAIIVALAKEKHQLMNQVAELKSIAPTKYQLPDGSVVIWRCPDELVPMNSHQSPR